MYQMAESIKVVDFDGLFLTAKFLAETNHTREILHLLGMRCKKFAIIFDGFDTQKKRFHLVSEFFRAQLYLTKVSPIELLYGSVEAEWGRWT